MTMDYLHAYWRMEYIEAPRSPQKSKANPFTEIPKAKNDKDTHIIWRGPLTYIVMNIYPYNAGHLLVVPYREVPDLIDLTADEQAELMQMIVFAKRVLTEAINPDGFNVGLNLGSAAGAGIPIHLHAHIVPRWEGDTNFMPVLGKTKVLPHALDTLWDRLVSSAQTLASCAPGA